MKKSWVIILARLLIVVSGCNRGAGPKSASVQPSKAPAIAGQRVDSIAALPAHTFAEASSSNMASNARDATTVRKLIQNAELTIVVDDHRASANSGFSGHHQPLGVLAWIEAGLWRGNRRRA